MRIETFLIVGASIPADFVFPFMNSFMDDSVDMIRVINGYSEFPFFRCMYQKAVIAVADHLSDPLDPKGR